jgi:hypothetical protein
MQIFKLLRILYRIPRCILYIYVIDCFSNDSMICLFLIQVHCVNINNIVSMCLLAVVIHKLLYLFVLSRQLRNTVE